MNIAVKPDQIALDEAYGTPLAELDPARTDRFQKDTIWPVFKRLREEAPVHLTEGGEFGPYWSLTRWDDIMAVDTNHLDFSSAKGIGLINHKNMAAQEEALRAIGQEPRRNGG